jgi:hypothetical protein
VGRDFVSLLFNWGRRHFHSVRQRQSQKFEDTFRRGPMAHNDIFVIKDQRLDLVFAKIICPARFVGCDAVAPFINYPEVELRCGAWLRSNLLAPKCLSGMPWPRRLLAQLDFFGASRCILAG